MENESKTENESQAARLLEKHGDRVFTLCRHVAYLKMISFFHNIHRTNPYFTDGVNKTVNVKDMMLTSQTAERFEEVSRQKGSALSIALPKLPQVHQPSDSTRPR